MVLSMWPNLWRQQQKDQPHQNGGQKVQQEQQPQQQHPSKEELTKQLQKENNVHQQQQQQQQKVMEQQQPVEQPQQQQQHPEQQQQPSSSAQLDEQETTPPYTQVDLLFENLKGDDVSQAATSLRHLRTILLNDINDSLNSRTEEEQREAAITHILNLARNTDILGILVRRLPNFDFEARKDAVLIFSSVLRRARSDNGTIISNLEGQQVLKLLILGYSNGEIALNCGSMLRDCVKHDRLVKNILEQEQVWKFFEYVELNHFDVASDAFETFKEILMRHVEISSEWIEKNEPAFEESYNKLLKSDNYVTRRQSLRLLGEMLMERRNFKFLQTYIAQPRNLQLIMNLLLDRRRNIQFEAFHVFKIFVLNPRKKEGVFQILNTNKEGMLTFFEDFLKDRDDSQFQRERLSIIKEIQKL